MKTIKRVWGVLDWGAKFAILALTIPILTIGMFIFSLYQEQPQNTHTIEYIEVPVEVKTHTLLTEIAEVTATVYRANAQECDADYLTTASGMKLDSVDQYQHRVLAISADLRRTLSWGDSVYVYGTGQYDGWWRVEDAMNNRWYRKIDLLINHDMPVGKWRHVKLFKEWSIE